MVDFMSVVCIVEAAMTFPRDYTKSYKSFGVNKVVSFRNHDISEKGAGTVNLLHSCMQWSGLYVM